MGGIKNITYELNGARYQIGRMKPLVGSYLWQKFVAAGFRAQQVFGGWEDPAAISVPEEPTLTPEQKMRGVCAVSLTQLSFEDYGLVLKEAMRVTRRLVSLNEGPEQPVPVMADDGRWAYPDLEEDPMAVTKLMMEALVFNLSSFLS